MLRAMGYHVYDSDARAKTIMDGSCAIKKFLVEEIHPSAVDARGRIDRAIVAGVVFSDSAALARLNGAVHAAVWADLRAWRDSHAAGAPLFVECAILCESGLAGEVDAVWEVAAPEAMRVARVCGRNGLSPAQVQARIDAQRAEMEAIGALRRSIVVNDGEQPMLPQVELLLEALPATSLSAE